MNYWAELQPYRSERLRCKNYTYGDQWKDIINVDGRQITEEQYIREEGNAPLKNNLIRRMVRNVIGVFRNNYEMPEFRRLASASEAWYLEGAYKHTLETNCYEELFSRVLEEYLIGGMAVVKKRVSRNPDYGVFTDMVRPESFFFNSDATDPRGWDITMAGEIHTLRSEEGGRRILEIWHRESDGWHYLFTDEEGRPLRKGRSPYPGADHPYVMKAYPFIDGEIHSFVADCIDQQRYINRLITLNDWVIRASAKGVLLFPENSIPDDLELEDIADQWSRYNGVIRYKAKTGVPMPQQVSTNSTNVGISELLSVQLKMMEEVSGVNAALQGQISSANTSGTLYEQQTRYALTGLKDIMEGFNSFILASARKDISLLRLIKA